MKVNNIAIPGPELVAKPLEMLVVLVMLKTSKHNSLNLLALPWNIHKSAAGIDSDDRTPCTSSSQLNDASSGMAIRGRTGHHIELG